jgi:hypothetical protein
MKRPVRRRDKFLRRVDEDQTPLTWLYGAGAATKEWKASATPLLLNIYF